MKYACLCFLFVIGNTCRSPIAEAVLIDIVKKAGCQRDWEIDSAAIENWHVGSRPNARAVAVMDKYYLAYDNRARQITTQDFYKFDYIFGMDDYNIEDLNDIKPNDATARIFLLGDFDPQGDRIKIIQIIMQYFNKNSFFLGERIIRDPFCVRFL